MAVVRINIPSKSKLPNLWDEIQPDFPMPSPRKFQNEALSIIYHALKKDDFDNIIIQAHTGIGKSAIAMTVQSQFWDQGEGRPADRTDRPRTAGSWPVRQRPRRANDR